VIVSFRHLLEERRARGAAVGAFTCYDATAAAGIVLAAEARGAPVVLLVGERSFRAPDGRLLASALLAIAGEARVPACVQLDHVSDLSLIETALSAGVGAVMADGSRLPLARNTRLVGDVRALASRHGAEVEAELGHVAGAEDAASVASGRASTDPDEAAAFVTETGACCLAVSIGNVHGVYASPPLLDWPRLSAIRARTDVPLSLHGASGLSDDDIRRAVELGVSKVNVNTELRERFYAELEHRVPETAPGYRVLELNAALVDAVAEVVERKLELLSSG
jgi:ketose-bisphosphate aldolase